MQAQTLYRKGERIGGRFLVHQALIGGMGEVYLCLDLTEHIPLALKTFQAGYLESFKAEVATWIALEKHPNIVSCYTMEVFDNHAFLVLEWVANDEVYGTELRRWLGYGALDLRTAFSFAIDICNGLIHASKKQPGIVHRDLKPDNVLIGQGRVAKITDFGLARIYLNSGIEKANPKDDMIVRRHLEGTPAYMAPEQWRGEVVSSQTDIYAVGCILYEMLTGEMLFGATEISELKRQHLEAPIPSIAKRVHAPLELDRVLPRCLAKHQDDRYGSIQDLQDEVTELYTHNFSALRTVRKQFERISAAEYNGRGVAYLNLGLYEKALADFTSAINLEPDEPANHVCRAKAYGLLQRFDEALVDLDRAIELKPNLAIAHTNRACAYLSLTRFEDAVREFAQAIALDPNYPIAYYNRAKLHEMFSRYNEAISDYTQAIRLDPNYSWAYNNRGYLYTVLRQHGKAFDDFANAIKTDPQHVLSHTNRGTLYMQMGQYDKAISDFTAAIQMDPSNVTAYGNRGGAYYLLSLFEKARSDFGMVVQLDPSNGLAHRNLGILAQDQGMLQDALRHYERAVQCGDSESQKGLTQVRTLIARKK